MKTRIISAAVMISVVIAAITVGKLYYPPVITAFIAVLTGIAVYELIHNAAGLKSIPLCLIPVGYSVIMSFLLDKSLYAGFEGGRVGDFFGKAPAYLTIVYFLIAVFFLLLREKEFSLERILAYTAYPMILSYAFSSLGGIISFESGIYYLLLLVNFASVCDTGAYFVGSFLGKHKLCPNISPKKTVEGSIGGIAASLIVSLILAACYGSHGNLAVTLAMTVLLCIVGMMGDLFASVIKRRAGIKDYGNLIPGHGGILDRFDSMLLIAPILYMLMKTGVI
ncbi:MAG: phosphatidate cytidylyltransferase [Clostridia bacterium]|nr:phosphatidate cytidylyltransferase [Clostridia bacterium]